MSEELYRPTAVMSAYSEDEKNDGFGCVEKRPQTSVYTRGLRRINSALYYRAQTVLINESYLNHEEPVSTSYIYMYTNMWRSYAKNVGSQNGKRTHWSH